MEQFRRSVQGENLRILRELAGWSQSELARAAGIKWAQQISHMETGARNIGPSMQKRFAKAFNIPVEELKRLLQSAGDPKIIELWLKLHEIDQEDCHILLKAFTDLIEVYHRSKDNPERFADTFDHLTRQIRILQALMKQK